MSRRQLFVRGRDELSGQPAEF